MRALKAITCFLGLLMASSASAMPYCLQNSEGNHCLYKTAMECEAARVGHDMCTDNLNDDISAQPSAPSPLFTNQFYLGPILYKYTLELCSEEERAIVEEPLRCEPDPKP